MDKTSDPARRVLGVIVVVAVLAIAGGAVLASQRDATPLDPASPEGVVQTYLTAVLAGDDDAALATFSEELRASCDTGFGTSRSDATRVVLRDTTIDGDSATVVVTIQVSTDPFDEYSYEERISLAAGAGGWEIDRIPWPYFGCR